MNYSHKKSFVTFTAKKISEYCFLEPTVMTQLKKQQNDRFYNYSQHQISFKLQTVFVARTHQQDFPPESANYRCLKNHLLEKQFYENRKQHMLKYRIQFKFWKMVSSHKVKGHQVLGC